MATKTITVGISLLVISLIAQAQEQKPTLNTKMQEMQKTLTSLLIFSSNDQRFSDPSNKKEIEKDLKELSKSTYHLDQNILFVDVDPAVKYLPNQLTTNTTEAYIAFREGNLTFSRNILRATVNYCIACHSRSAAELQISKSFYQPPSTLSNFELAQYLAISRQFDLAIEKYIKAIQDETLDRSDLEEAVNQSLAIAVRVKNKPSLAMEIVQTLIKSKTAPVYLKMNALEWKKSITTWVSKNKYPPETESAYFSQAKKLLDQAQKIKKFPMDRSADIYYLRASGLLHELIRIAPQSKHLSEALYLEGICYDILSPRKLESMSNIYYEACIRSSPHTEISENCYRRYEENIYFAYSGVSGTQLPVEMKNKLIELWTISMMTKRLDEVRK